MEEKMTSCCAKMRFGKMFLTVVSCLEMIWEDVSS